MSYISFCKGYISALPTQQESTNRIDSLPMGPEEQLYLVTYKDPIQKEVLSIKVTTICDSPLGFNFIYISGFIFNNDDTLLISPKEEKIENLFKDTKSMHLPIYSILSIQELGKEKLSLSEEHRKLIHIAPNPDENNNPN